MTTDMDSIQDDHTPSSPGQPLPQSSSYSEQMVEPEDPGDTERQQLAMNSHANGHSVISVTSQNSPSMHPRTDVEDASAPNGFHIAARDAVMAESEIPDYVERRSSPVGHEDSTMQDAASSSEMQDVPTISHADNDILSENIPQTHQEDMKVDQQILAPPRNIPPAYQVKFIMSGHTRSVSSLKFSPDGTMLASAGKPFSTLR